MSAAALESFLARLYTDTRLRRAFLARPEATARESGLDETTVGALAAIDREGLELAAASFEGKRATHAGKRRNRWFGR